MSYPVLVRTPENDTYPVCSAQKQLYLLESTVNMGSVYVLTSSLIIRGDLDYSRLNGAVRKVMQRHDSLRTSFLMQDGEIRQKVHPHACTEVEFKDLSTLPGDEDAKIHGFTSEFIRSFDLHHPPLFRVGLGEISPKYYILIISMHHIIADGISLSIVLRELMSFYMGEELPALSIRYRDFAVWQQTLFESEILDEQRKYWEQVLAKDDLPSLDFPYDFPRPSVRTFEGLRSRFELSEELVRELRNIAKRQRVTVSVLLFSVFTLLLSKYSRQSDIMLGIAVTGRYYPEFKSVVGMFVNILPVRVLLDPEWSFSHYCHMNSELIYKIYNAQDVPFEDMTARFNQKNEPSRHPFFDVAFVYHQEFDFHTETKVGELVVKNYFAPRHTVQQDLCVHFIEHSDGGIHGVLEYNTSLLKKETSERFINHFQHLLALVPGNLLQALTEYDLLTIDEREHILKDFNQTALEIPRDITVYQAFQQTASRMTSQIALIYEDHHLTYGELNRKSNQLALQLKEKGVTPEQLIAITAEMSVEMVIGILAILKAGGAFLPLDPKLPVSRMKLILQENGIKFILSQRVLRELVAQLCVEETIYMDDPENDSRLDLELTTNIRPGQLAYVIFTSGTTGKPKGVMVEQGSLWNLCCWHIHYFQITEKDRATRYAGFGFDASVWELFPYLIRGATIHMIPETYAMEMGRLNRYYEKNQITISFLPTQICERFITEENHSLRWLLTGGDKLQHFIKRDYLLVNNYGPTESTVVATCFPVHESSRNIPIGKPIANTRVYILGSDLRPQPIGIPGEIYIAGSGLARGYLGDPESTAEKFLPCPFRPGERMYRTGDLAIWLPDGNIQFMGRVDHQVKIRGFRIEIDEIVHCLLQHPDVEEAIVVVRQEEENNKCLCAYLVGARINLSELRNYLRNLLPNYMIPSYFLRVERLPLNPNGKVDHAALPKPEPQHALTNRYEAPRTETEKTLVKLWEEVLEVGHIGIYDPFYDLGGHSLKAMTLLSRINQNYRTNLQLLDINRHPTVKDLGYLIDQKAEESGTKPIIIPKVLRQSYYYLENGEQDMILPGLTCQEKCVYLIIKSNYGFIKNIRSLFLNDITCYVACDTDGQLVDIGFNYIPWNQDLITVQHFYPEKERPLEILESLLDQGKLVVVQTVMEKLSFSTYYNPDLKTDQIKENQHSFLIIHHDDEWFYFVDEVYTINPGRYISSPYNNEVGLIAKSELYGAVRLFARFFTVETEIGRLKEGESRIPANIRFVVGNYEKNSITKENTMIYYGKHALSHLMNLIEKGNLNLLQPMPLYGINLYEVFKWRIGNIFNRRILLRDCLQEYYQGTTDLSWDMAELTSVFDADIREWIGLFEDIEMMYRTHQYIPGMKTVKCLIRIQEKEEELIAFLCTVVM